MMKVLESRVLGGERPLTFLKLDADLPLTAWRRAVIGGNEFVPALVSGDARDSLCIPGSHSFVGENVELV